MRSIREHIVSVLDTLGAGNSLRKWRRSRRADWAPLIPEKEFGICVANAIDELSKRGHRFGDYLEFGVSRGHSFAAIHDITNDRNLKRVRLIGFDSFEGLPPEAAQEGWKPGEFYSALSATRKFLTSRGIDWGRCFLVKGWFKNTLNDKTIRKFNIERASLIMIDCDIYSASRDALWFCAPLIGDHAVIFFDDWGWGPKENRIGQIEAFRAFLEQFQNFKAEPLAAYHEYARVFLITADNRAAEKDAASESNLSHTSEIANRSGKHS